MGFDFQRGLLPCHKHEVSLLLFQQMFLHSDEQWPNPWLLAVYRGIILPSYVEIKKNYYKDPY